MPVYVHFDHCGGNHVFAGRPFYVQRRELDDARSEDNYTIREWVEAPGVADLRAVRFLSVRPSSRHPLDDEPHDSVRFALPARCDPRRSAAPARR